MSYQELNAIFGEHGKLAETITGYAPRPGQIEMANAVALAIQNGRNLIAEAGTGTGKTFAYLIPAILSGKRVIVSTGTKNLQDQLFNKDLPLIRKVLTTPFNASLLKGRANYLCTYRLEQALDYAYGYSQNEAKALTAINRWASKTKTGDISEVADVHDGDPVWMHATSTIDNCLGSDCPDYAECFLVKARRRAQEAEIVVVNHHLLCADWSIRENGFGELLPTADVVLIDEAHQLAETASNFLGLTVSGNQLLELATDTLAEFFKDAKDMPELRTACEGLQFAVRDLRLAFGPALRRGDWPELLNYPAVTRELAALERQLETLVELLVLAAVRTKGLENCLNRAETLAEQLDSLLYEEDNNVSIRWFETHSKSFTLSRTPLNIANEFQSFMQTHKATWIFTSATLSVANSFDYFASHLGLADADRQSWDSPFDYPNQALFYHPRGLPQPSDGDFTDKILDFVVPVLEASQGRAFFLFTSHKALQRAAQLLEQRIDYPLLVQGSRSKSRLLEEFKRQPHSVLLATASFWEGVDVRGDALSCVIIDKLPFASPGDPVLKARLATMEQQGRNPFMEYQIPNAVIMLRQGIGRLIRDVNDRGVLMVCDPRLLKPSYGQYFLDSIPAMKRSRELVDVQRFFVGADG